MSKIWMESFYDNELSECVCGAKMTVTDSYVHINLEEDLVRIQFDLSCNECENTRMIHEEFESIGVSLAKDSIVERGWV
ncbi:MAG: hypothetical protein ACRCZZ_08240 [Phocaeicola sp.]